MEDVARDEVPQSRRTEERVALEVAAFDLKQAVGSISCAARSVAHAASLAERLEHDTRGASGQSTLRDHSDLASRVATAAASAQHLMGEVQDRKARLVHPAEALTD